MKDRVGAKVQRLLIPVKKEQPQIGFKAQQSGKQTEPKQERRQAPPIVENKADFKPANDTETLLGVLRSNKVAKPTKWLESYIDAMLDNDLQYPKSTKPQMIEKYKVSSATVDTLRGRQAMIFNIMGEERARKALEEIKKGLNR